MKYFMLIRNKELGSNNDCNFGITKSLKILNLIHECQVRDIKNKTIETLSYLTFIGINMQSLKTIGQF